MQIDINTLISLGILGVVSFLVRGVFALREDIKAIKVVLGMNGTPDVGVIHEIVRLRDAKHEHASELTALRIDVDSLLQR